MGSAAFHLGVRVGPPAWHVGVRVGPPASHVGARPGSAMAQSEPKSHSGVTTIMNESSQ